jgi:pSer/pThr/pTyr-binding forkhead associated (FHA) protein
MSPSPFADFIGSYDAGELLFAAGDPAHTLFVVQPGSVALEAPGDGELEVLAVMERGDFFGEMSLLEGTPRPFNARAQEPTDVIEISSALFDRMIRSNIELAVRMLRKLSLRLSEAEERNRSRPRKAPSPSVEEPATEISDAAPPTVADGNGDRPDDVASTPPAEPDTALPVAPETARLINPDGSEVFPMDGSNIRVGRFDPVTGTRPEVDLTLLDLKRSVSRRHALLVADDDSFLLSEEVGALNGTLVNGERLSTGEPVRLEDGDQLSFGGVTLILQLSSS